MDLSNGSCLLADTNSSNPTSSGRRSLGCAFGFGLAALRAGLSRTRVGIAVGGCARVRKVTRLFEEVRGMMVSKVAITTQHHTHL
jgi:hypothetical protein